MSDLVVDAQKPSLVAAVFAEEGFARVASPILNNARLKAAQEGLPYAGSVSPQDAWALYTAGEAVLVDVRTAEERKFVGHVPETKHVAWMTGLSLWPSSCAARNWEARPGKGDTIRPVSRSGRGPPPAAEAAAKAGFTNVFNILEGFEGDLDEQQRRGAFNGWRHAGLPWVQD